MNVTLTLRQWPDEPDHRLASNVPADVPLSELLGDSVLALTIADIEAGRIGPPTDGGTRGYCIWRDSRVVAGPAELNRPPPSRRARECIGPVIPQRRV
jgi:hypothetical protein